MHGAYQMPLFEWYPISVEFERRRGYIRARIHDRWSALRELTDAELIDLFWPTGELCPIELNRGELEIEEVGCTDGAIEYTARVPYAGDGELWQLYPRDLAKPLPEGEIFRGKLILEVVAKSRYGLDAILANRLSSIVSVLDEQRSTIGAFGASLPIFIRAEVHKMRRRDSSGATSRPWADW